MFWLYYNNMLFRALGDFLALSKEFDSSQPNLYNTLYVHRNVHIF